MLTAAICEAAALSAPHPRTPWGEGAVGNRLLSLDPRGQLRPKSLRGAPSQVEDLRSTGALPVHSLIYSVQRPFEVLSVVCLKNLRPRKVKSRIHCVAEPELDPQRGPLPALRATTRPLAARGALPSSDALVWFSF